MYGCLTATDCPAKITDVWQVAADVYFPSQPPYILISWTDNISMDKEHLSVERSPNNFSTQHPEKQDGNTLLTTANSSTATEKNSSTISYLNYLIRVSKYYNRYQVSYTVYSKQDYTIGVCIIL